MGETHQGDGEPSRPANDIYNLVSTAPPENQSMAAIQPWATEQVKINSAARDAALEARVEETAPPMPEGQPVPNLALVENAQTTDPMDGKLGWAMQYVDDAKQQGVEPDRVPSFDVSQERPPGEYDGLKQANERSPLPEGPMLPDPKEAHYLDLAKDADAALAHQYDPQLTQPMER